MLESYVGGVNLHILSLGEIVRFLPPLLFHVTWSQLRVALCTIA